MTQVAGALAGGYEVTVAIVAAVLVRSG